MKERDHAFRSSFKWAAGAMLVTLMTVIPCSDRQRSLADEGGGDPQGRNEDPQATFELLGGMSLLPFGDRDAVISKTAARPTDPSPSLPQYLYFPPEMRLDSYAHTNFGIMKLGTGYRGYTVWYGSLRCWRVQRDDPLDNAYPYIWSTLRDDINAYLRAFHRPAITLRDMNDALVSKIVNDLGGNNAEIDAGQWWLTRPLSESFDIYTVLPPNALGPGQQSISLRACLPLELTCAGPRAQSGELRVNALDQEKVELEIRIDDHYFGQKTALDPKHFFDALDAEYVGERIKVDARFRLCTRGEAGDTPVSGYDFQNVPCFAMKESSRGQFRWVVRFRPPCPTADDQYWVASVRAVSWHVDDPKSLNYDEQNKTRGLAQDGGNQQSETHYHYWGYNDYADDLMYRDDDTSACPDPGTWGNRHTQRQPNADHKVALGAIDDVLPIPRFRFKVGTGSRNGPLSKPQGDESPFYFCQEKRQADGSFQRQPMVIVGEARPDAVSTIWPDGINENKWNVGDRRELMNAMVAAKMNFNSSWMSPWETMLVHQAAQKEEWFGNDGTSVASAFQPLPDAQQAMWTYHAYYDQGRAMRLDAIMRLHDETGSGGGGDVYSGLFIWPHLSLSLWAETAPAGKEHMYCGFGAFAPTAQSADFYRSAQQQEGKLRPVGWQVQRNLYRYIIARWGFSRSLALWGTVAEYNSIDNLIVNKLGPNGLEVEVKGWYDNGDITTPWHDALVGEIRTLDQLGGMAPGACRAVTGSGVGPNGARDSAFNGGAANSYTYDGNNQHKDIWAISDYFGVFAADGSSGYTADYTDSGFPPFYKGSLAWTTDHPWRDYRIWHYAVGRSYNWVRNLPTAKPCLATEFGMPEKDPDGDSLFSPGGRLERVVRSFIHYGIWSAFANGHMGTPLTWCSGFDMFPHTLNPNNPNYATELTAMATVVADIGPSTLGKLRVRKHSGTGDQDSGQVGVMKVVEGQQPAVRDGARVFMLGAQDNSAAVIWVYDDDLTAPATDPDDPRQYGITHADAMEGCKVRVQLAANAVYTVSTYNTWTGQKAPDLNVTADAAGWLEFDVGSLACSATLYPPGVWDGADTLFVIRAR